MVKEKDMWDDSDVGYWRSKSMSFRPHIPPKQTPTPTPPTPPFPCPLEMTSARVMDNEEWEYMKIHNPTLVMAMMANKYILSVALSCEALCSVQFTGWVRQQGVNIYFENIDDAALFKLKFVR